MVSVQSIKSPLSPHPVQLNGVSFDATVEVSAASTTSQSKNDKNEHAVILLHGRLRSSEERIC
jgi:hypothetical protein